jgi:hypothetical protein
MFFPEGSRRHDLRRRAIALCCACPRVEECLRFALHDENLAGIWGATDEKARRRARSWLRHDEQRPGNDVPGPR